MGRNSRGKEASEQKSSGEQAQGQSRVAKDQIDKLTLISACWPHQHLDSRVLEKFQGPLPNATFLHREKKLALSMTASLVPCAWSPRKWFYCSKSFKFYFYFLNVVFNKKKCTFFTISSSTIFSLLYSEFLSCPLVIILTFHQETVTLKQLVWIPSWLQKTRVCPIPFCISPG